MAKYEISNSRKVLYYGGMLVIFIGVLLFLSTFVRFMGITSDFGSKGLSIGGFMGPPFIGIILIAIGNIMRSIGLKGTAGSGIILNPKQARKDLKPWTKMAGGMVSDVLGETNINKRDSVNTVVKVRCTNCKTLNDEDSKFCKSCGENM